MLESFGADSPNWVAAAQQVALIQSLYTQNREYALSCLAPGEELVVWQSNRDTWPPSYLCVKRGDSYWVTIEGSTNNLQFGTHTYGAWVRQDFLGDSSVNGSWWGATREIRGALPSLASGHWHFSGHSYGAACAAIIAMEVADARGSDAVELLTFAAPKYMTNGYSGSLPKPCWRVEATTDMVPSLPPFGSELVGTVWRNPLEWVRTDWFFWEYGDVIVLNSKGQVNGELYDRDARGEWNVIGFPESHYLRNYWGRLNARMLREGNPSPMLAQWMAKAKQAWFPESQQKVAVEYPGVIPGPTGEPVVIPTNDQPYFPTGGTMAVYQVNLVFEGQNKRTWREGHAVEATTAAAAAALLNDNDILGKRAAFLAKIYKIANVEAVNQEDPRDGTVRTAGVQGAISTTKAETAGVAWNLGWFLENNYPQRWAPVRGFPDTVARYNNQTGTVEIEQAIQDAVREWVSAVKIRGFGSYQRLREVPTDPTLAKNYITSLNGDLTPGMTVITVAAAVNLGSARKVSIHLRGEDTKKALPGLHGNLFPVVATSGQTLTIPYTIPRGGVLAPGSGSYLRPARFVLVQYQGFAEAGDVFAKRTRKLK